MARYKVLVDSFINNFLHKEGDIVEFDGVAAGNLELIVEEKAAAKAHKAPAKAEHSAE